MSNKNWGFLIILIQNLSGKLKTVNFRTWYFIVHIYFATRFQYVSANTIVINM
jgi:hypothetical protein